MIIYRTSCPQVPHGGLQDNALGLAPRRALQQRHQLARQPALHAVLVDVAQRLEGHVMLPPNVVAAHGRISFVIPAILAGFEVAA